MRAYRVAYDGRAFHGFQRQPDVPTVSDALLDALVSLDVIPASDGPSRPTPPGYAAAGRTDAGVSALAQTVAFDAPDWLTPRAFDARLPDAVHVWAASDTADTPDTADTTDTADTADTPDTGDTPDDFHATHDAHRRRYRYFLPAPPGTLADTARPVEETPAAPVDTVSISDHTPTETRVEHAAVRRVRETARQLSGHHDYHNLTPDETGTTREVTIRVTPLGRTIALDVASDGFPRQLVRRLATLCRAAAADTLPAGRVERLLGPGAIDGPEGVPPAPPEPLVLAHVAYDLSFERDATAVERAREAFGDRARTATSVAHVARFVARGVADE